MIALLISILAYLILVAGNNINDQPVNYNFYKSLN